VSDSTGTLWKILNDQSPVAVVFYSSHAAREDLLDLARLMAPSERPIRQTDNVDDAFRELDTILLLTPADEQAAVLTLDGRRDALRDRTAPVVLFLLRGGSADERLRTEAAGLESWLRGMEYDPERLTPLDLTSERTQFEQQTGQAPEAWLSAWRRGDIEDTLDNNLLAHRATLLEQVS
jgi:hypothetical protein